MESFAPTEYPFPLRRVVRAGDYVIVAGQFGQKDFRLVNGSIEGQARQALVNVRDLLASVAVHMSQVVKCRIILANISDFDAMNRVYLEFLGAESLPARTTWSGELPFGALVEIEAWAHTG